MSPRRNRVILGMCLGVVAAVSIALLPGGRDREAGASDRGEDRERVRSGGERAGEIPVAAKSGDRRVPAEGDLLARKNAALEAALRRAELAERQASLMAEIAGKLAAPEELAAPVTSAEAAVFMGEAHRRAMDFGERWEEPPSEDSADFAAYSEAREAMTTGLASIMKLMNSSGEGLLKEIVGSADGLAEFQSLHLFGALQLDDAQWRQVHEVLDRHYADGYALGLNGASRPEEGVDLWEERRSEQSRKAYDEIRVMLPAGQRSDFERLYDSSFLWTMSIGIGG